MESDAPPVFRPRVSGDVWEAGEQIQIQLSLHSAYAGDTYRLAYLYDREQMSCSEPPSTFRGAGLVVQCRRTSVGGNLLFSVSATTSEDVSRLPASVVLPSSRPMTPDPQAENRAVVCNGRGVDRCRVGARAARWCQVTSVSGQGVRPDTGKPGRYLCRAPDEGVWFHSFQWRFDRNTDRNDGNCTYEIECRDFPPPDATRARVIRCESPRSDGGSTCRARPRTP